MYATEMDVAITELRSHLGDWLEHARQGHDVVVTDRGVPVARLVGISSADTIERLTREGIISAPVQPARPVARSRKRPRSLASVADLVSEQRR